MSIDDKKEKNFVFFVNGQIIIDKKYSIMIKTLRGYLDDLGFSREQYKITLKKTYIELQLQSLEATRYILYDENSVDLDFIQHTDQPILIVTWK